MLFNTSINGITLPVEIAEEELTSKGYALAKDNACKDTALRESFIAWIIDNYVGFEKEETEEALIDSEKFGVIKGNALDIDDDSFVYHVLSGNLKDSIQELVNEMESEEKIYEVTYDLSRRVTLKQTVTFTIRAKDGDDLCDKVDDLCYDDIEQFVDEDGWEEDYWKSDEPELEAWDSEEVADEGWNHYEG